jgi:hypothetical protein
MSSVAVSLTQPDGELVSGILLADPKVGQDCRIYLGGERIHYIRKVRGWIGPAHKEYVILFDCHGNRYRLKLLATSDQFL